MEYWFYSVLTWTTLTLCGLPFCFLFLPLKVQKYSFGFAASFGYCYIVFSSYYLYRFNLPGTDSYAFSLFLFPSGLTILYGLRILKIPLRWRDYFSEDVIVPNFIAALGMTIISLPFIFKEGMLTSLSLSNLDIVELATVSRFLQEFPRDSQIGILGQSNLFVETGDDVWFGPSAIVAFMSSILRSEPYKIQSLVMNVISAQGIIFVFFFAKESLGIYRIPAIGISILYAINPVIMYMIWQSFGGQMITTVLVLGVCSLHVFAINECKLPKDYYPFIGVLLILSSGILLTYHFMLFVIYIIVFVYGVIHLFYVNLQFADKFKIMIISIFPLVLALILNPFRAYGVVSGLKGLINANSGWFIPWLSPDVLMGSNAITIFMGMGSLDDRLVWVLFAIILFTNSITISFGNRHELPHFKFILGMFSPVFIVGLYFAVRGSENGILGGYRSFKMTSTFCAFTLITVSIGFYKFQWQGRKIKTYLSLVVFLAVFVASTFNLVRMSMAMNDVYTIPEELIELEKIQSMPNVAGVNVMDTDNYSLLWINYFLFKKPQNFQRFPYAGRPVGNPDQEYFLRINQELYRKGNRGDIFFVSGKYFGVEEIEINNVFSIYKAAKNTGLVITPGDGWWAIEPTHRWSGSNGRSSSIYITNNGEVISVAIEASFWPLRDREDISVYINERKVRTKSTDTKLESEPFTLESGRHTITFVGTLEPTIRSHRDPRTLQIAWELITLKMMPLQTTEKS